MPTRRSLLATLPALGAALPAAARAQAAWVPDRPLRIVLPFAAGGNTDVMARVVAEPMGARLGKPVVVVARPGGGGTIGTEVVARAAPDGTTLLLGSGGTMVANPVLQAHLPYDAEKDFRPIGLIATVPLGLVVGPRQRAEGWPAMAAAAKAAPGSISVATPGNGSVAHLALELLQRGAGVQLTHVPYRGGGALVPDLLGGTVDASLLELTTALPLHQSGQARLLAVASPQRAALLPEVPSFQELGVEGFTALSFGGLLLPVRTPDPVAAALLQALQGALADLAVQSRLATLGATIASAEQQTPAGFGAFLAAERARARQAAELAGLKPE
ncbi:tripartite tricarboxylate transporter substrate binding protein [Siccirubricoccus sp. KC 17139]|uniref:Tripartite tricarboxylate transporter substrate binding protein n=1 Tax=Siccirubricoccus soli TaxID=2899147 RepID=A0ABT1D7D3_9PROT|nr:tripartite tricarboxylate transporter substrate binding protein [Siccirubricoccus soli]MCO6417512.1 tripartite tricarboxylate transporter substrate binding protein [Siccirubricoccus soli]MCP2683647.1 tripartite tricarboxylate transporter substrate binding protein [Siccirubricoccus soli]